MLFQLLDFSIFISANAYPAFDILSFVLAEMYFRTGNGTLIQKLFECFGLCFFFVVFGPVIALQFIHVFIVISNGVLVRDVTPLPSLSTA